MTISEYTNRHGIFATLTHDVVFNEALSIGRVYEEDMILHKILPLLKHVPNATLLDIGANIGCHSILYAKYLPTSTVLAFEPQETIFKLLQHNVIKNKLANIKLYNTAVGHKECQCTMSKMLYDGYNIEINYNSQTPFNSGGISIGENGEQINMVTIDQFNLDRCDYIKMDVEGAEPLVLLGALETIKKHKPIIVFECSDKTVSDEMRRALGIDFPINTSTTLLTELGYTITNLEGCNFIAMHKGS